MTATVIFELDGILIDSRKYDFIALQEALRDIHINLTEQDYSRLVGLSEPEFNRQMHKNLFVLMPDSIKQRRKDLLKSIIREAKKDTSAAKELLARLKKNGIKRAVVSSSDEEYMRFVLSELGMKDDFDLMVSANSGDIRKLKDGGELLLAAAGELSSPKESCIYVCDTVYGIYDCKKVGIRCVALPNDMTSNHDFSDADFKISKLDEFDDVMIAKMFPGSVPLQKEHGSAEDEEDGA